jgi:hypothetical protein
MQEEMPRYVVQPVAQNDCYRMWRHVRDLLAPAIAESSGRWKPEYVFTALTGGYQTLWVILDADDIVAAFTTEIANYPERRMICIHYLGGQGFDDWYPDMLREVTMFGRTAGCDGIECNARHGFWRWFKHDGFKKKSTFYELDI